MVVACPLKGGPGERRCGCGRRVGSPRVCRCRKSRDGYGCRRQPCTAGGSDGVAVRLRRRPALDAGSDVRPDRPDVPCPLHPTWHCVPAAPHGLVGAGATASRGRTRRAGDRHLAAGGLAGGKTLAAQRDAWICFEDEAGQTLRPPKARTWGRRGRTPVVPVSGKVPGGSRSRVWSA